MAEFGKLTAAESDALDRYQARLDWCRANGHEVWPNGWIGPDACAAYRQVQIEAESDRRIAAANTESLVTT